MNPDTHPSGIIAIRDSHPLEGTSNIEKQATLPADWIRAKYPCETDREHYCEKYFLGEVPDGMVGFLEFYETRRARLKEHISALVNSV